MRVRYARARAKSRTSARWFAGIGALYGRIRGSWPTETPVDFGQQRRGWNRLGQISVATRRHTPLAVAGECVGSHGDDRNVFRGRIGFENRRRFPTVELGNRNVHQHEI